MKNKCFFLHDWETGSTKVHGMYRVCMRCHKLERYWGARWVSGEEYKRLDNNYRNRKKIAAVVFDEQT